MDAQNLQRYLKRHIKQVDENLEIIEDKYRFDERKFDLLAAEPKEDRATPVGIKIKIPPYNRQSVLRDVLKDYSWISRYDGKLILMNSSADREIYENLRREAEQEAIRYYLFAQKNRGFFFTRIDDRYFSEETRQTTAEFPLLDYLIHPKMIDFVLKKLSFQSDLLELARVVMAIHQEKKR
jgi:hypothetical protein